MYVYRPSYPTLPCWNSDGQLQTWEHYSSIRNLDGPHSGLPNVTVKVLSPQEEEKQKQILAEAPLIQPWMINNVMQSLPFLADKAAIKRMLEETKGNVNAAVDKLLEEEDKGSISSTQESSSVEREPDSDDDAIYGPNKRRERHLNRTADNTVGGRLSPKSRLLERHQQRLRRLKDMEHTQASSSQESLASVDSQDNDPSQNIPRITFEQAKSSDLEEDDWRPVSENEDSAASGPSAPPSPRPIRLKINPPKMLSEQHTTKSIGKTQQRQLGPQRRKGPTARERKDIKKLAQKAARKERALADAGLGNSPGVAVPIRPKGPPIPAVVESGLKTLYI